LTYLVDMTISLLSFLKTLVSFLQEVITSEEEKQAQQSLEIARALESLEIKHGEQSQVNHPGPSAPKGESSLSAPLPEPLITWTPRRKSPPAESPLSPNRFDTAALRAQFAATGVCRHFVHRTERPRLLFCPICKAAVGVNA